MSVIDTHRHVPASGRRPPDRLTRWSIGLSAVSAAVLAASSGSVAVIYLVGSESRIEDTWLGALFAAVVVVGLVGALGAFVAAAVLRLRGERRAALWLALSLFPVCVLLLVLGEVFWWE
jgi:hypothetical protein